MAALGSYVEPIVNDKPARTSTTNQKSLHILMLGATGPSRTYEVRNNRTKPDTTLTVLVFYIVVIPGT